MVNSGVQTWKACWWQRLASSNLASSATPTRANMRAGRIARPALMASGLNYGPEIPAQSGLDPGIHSLQLNHDGVPLHLLAAPLPSRAFRSPTLSSLAKSPVPAARADYSAGRVHRSEIVAASLPAGTCSACPHSPDPDGLARFIWRARPRQCRLPGGAGCWRDRRGLSRTRRTAWTLRRPGSWHRRPRGSA
jgi:hypothetical protein